MAARAEMLAGQLAQAQRALPSPSTERPCSSDSERSTDETTQTDAIRTETPALVGFLAYVSGPTIRQHERADQSTRQVRGMRPPA